MAFVSVNILKLARFKAQTEDVCIILHLWIIDLFVTECINQSRPLTKSIRSSSLNRFDFFIFLLKDPNRRDSLSFISISFLSSRKAIILAVLADPLKEMTFATSGHFFKLVKSVNDARTRLHWQRDIRIIAIRASAS